MIDPGIQVRLNAFNNIERTSRELILVYVHVYLVT